MSLRKAILLLIVPVLLLSAGIGAWTWLLHTESGARWMFGKLGSSPAFVLRTSSISGDLGSGLKLEDLYFENDATRVEITKIATAVNIDLFPPAVKVDRVHAEAITIKALEPPGQDSEDPADLHQVLRGLSLPVPVYVEDIDLNRIDFLDASGKNIIQLHAVTASGDVHETLALDSLSLTTEGHDLNLAGQLGFTPPHSLDVQFITAGEFSVTGQISGSLEQLQLEINSQAPVARLTGSLARLLDEPEWDVELNAPDLRWPLTATEPDVNLTDLVARSQGRWSAYRLELDSSLLLPGLEPGRLELAGNGGTDTFSAENISLDGSQLSLQSQVDLSWENELTVAANAILQRLNPVAWVEDWPEQHHVAGELALEWSGDEISVPAFELSVSDTPFVASGNGLFDLPSGVVVGQLGWKALSWPPAAPVPQFASRQGKFDVSGSPENWQLDGWLDFQAAEFPEGRLQLSGAGNLESLEVQVHEGAVLGGTLAGEVSFGWTGQQPFQLALRARDIHTAALVEDFPGILSAEFSAGGQLEPLAAEVEIQQLEGMLRKIPLIASGGFKFGEDRINVRSLEVTSGASKLTLDGDPYAPEGIRFAADIEALSHFHDEFSGSLSSRGSISLNPDSPSLSGTLTAQQLLLGTIAIEAIETRQNELVLSDLTLGKTVLESLTLGFNSGNPLERLDILAAVENRTIRIGLEGSVVDWSEPVNSGWRGQLVNFELERDQFSISLDQPAPLEMTRDQFSLQDLCLTGSRNATLCAAASWKAPDEINLSTELSAIPLSLLELFVESDVRFNQVLSGTLDWRQAAGGNRSGNARIEMSPGVITLEGEDNIQLETGVGLFGFEVTNGRLQSGILDLSLPQIGAIDVNFSAADLRQGTESPVQGTARIDLSDIGVVGKIFPVFDTIDGVLDVDLTLSGTISDPSFKGRASLANGAISNQASGFSFSDINLAGEVTELDQMKLNGSFTAGDGSGEISAQIIFADILSPVIDFELTGQDLTVIDVPDLKIIANPDVQLSWQDKTLTINGRVEIPATRLAPSYLPQASIRQSADVVVVAGELPVVEQDFLKENAIKLKGTLEVVLGEDVVVDLDVAQIDVTGSAQFNWQDDLIPVANGSFNGTGDIQAFGQFLRITRGRVSFTDTPADNPHLNIRAEREIFGNSQVRTAGLMVAGTLKRPVVEPYTVPMTTRERAQTLLVTGSDFNYEQGVGAVDVGMYVLPRLYVSYGIGVFEDGNVLKVRYDLGRGFGVTATSGQRETGLDINYIIER
jgi:translocation and assembly module TamB